MQAALPRDDLDLVLSLTSTFWSRFAGARLFITGGTGFIGNWLIQTVQHANDTLDSRIEIVTLSRDPERARRLHPQVFDRSDIQLLGGDIASFAYPEGPLDLCLHAATDVTAPARTASARHTFDAIVDGTRRVLDLAQARGVRRFLLASSGAIYGTQPADLPHVPESYLGAPDPLQAAAAYGNGKRAAEWLTAACAAEGLQAVIARIFALIGPGMPMNGPFAAGNFLRDALANAPIVIQGDGRPLRSYLYMADLCVWLLRILESGASGQAYNVGSEHPVSIRQLAEQVVQATGSCAPIDVRAP
ncbi:MAG: NAD(P)-dependent oxidoreductase, partial [Hylemonella sp.]|nr:NAD(P)-dependent oxidoreductase [Hylemonella sp.]